MNKILLYGANGYTGSLIARLAVQLGLRPLLAGRNEEKIKPLAAYLNLEYRSLALSDTMTLETELQDVVAVLHCAGPFQQTWKPMVTACLRTKTHYLDITGEWMVLEAIAALDAEAKAAGVMLLPGVGFDVVPSDCLAAHLKVRMPAAQKLAIAFQMNADSSSLSGQLSRGTATTIVEGRSCLGMVRQNGVLTPVPAAWKTRTIDLGRGQVFTATLPWGDVSTAYYSTGIPDIEVYTAVSPSLYRMMIASRYLGWFLSLPAVQNFQKRAIALSPPGPTDLQRQQGITLLWGEVEDKVGNKLASRLQCPEGYTLTAMTAVTILEKVLAGEVEIGFQTPSLAYGADLILSVDGVVREDIT
ncbi:MAG: saccharopine dehydrogenase NADP-binding domain-containing protein [Hormoscilla sp. GM102CHS1]|nr:saccharopine dehydrogenase NADP-binding domain-containing protein [Hormoscilla sp. GM102CHS1]